MSELLPCPFCGNTKIHDYDYIKEQQCGRCGARTKVNNWNSRPFESALREQIERERMPNEVREILIMCVKESMAGQIYSTPRRESALDWLNKVQPTDNTPPLVTFLADHMKDEP